MASDAQPLKFFGIDLGTSKCCVAYAILGPRPGNPTPIVVGYRPDANAQPVDSIPSVIIRKPGKKAATGTTLFAFEADKALSRNQVKPARSGQTVFRSVKSELGTGRCYPRADASLNTPVKVWASLIREICELTVAAKGPEFDPRQHPTVLTVPASFGLAQREETLEAAKQAGFKVGAEPGLVQLIDEPVAALIDTINHADIDLHSKAEGSNHVLVFDFGGGTCDLALVEFRYDSSQPTDIEVTPLAISEYKQLGGDTIDLEITNKVIEPQVGRQIASGIDELSAKERRTLRDQIRHGVARRLKELVNADITNLPKDKFDSRQWDDIQVRQSLTGVSYSAEKTLGGTATLSGEELFEIFLPFFNPDPEADDVILSDSSKFPSFAKLIASTMVKAGMSPDELDMLVLHGGSCKSRFVPWAFNRMKEDGFFGVHCHIIESPDQIASVARGAALFGCLSKKYGKPYLKPIIPKDINIETVGREFVAVAHAGDPLPLTKVIEKQLFLSKDRQRQMVIPIWVGNQDDGDLQLASTLEIPTEQENLAQSHPVVLQLDIDTDKISRWQFSLKGFSPLPVREVPNPWTSCAAGDEIEKLQGTRRAIRDSIEKGVVVAERLLADEALQAARAGYSEEGLALIEDILDDAQSNYTAWNIKALIHGRRGEDSKALACHEKAASLAPDNMILKGNYGTALVRDKQHEKAIAVMREALSKDASLTYLHSWLADAFQGLDNIEEMNKELEMWHVATQRQAIKQPDDISALEELVITARRTGRYDLAEEANEYIQRLRRTEDLLAGPRHG